MAKIKTKADFIGIRVTREQNLLLSKLQENLQLASKTDVLLEGLELLAEYYSLPNSSLKKGGVGSSFPKRWRRPDSPLGRLEVDTWRHVGALYKIKNGIEEVIKQVVQELGNTDKKTNKDDAYKKALIQTLSDIQAGGSTLPKSVLSVASNRLGMPVSEISRILEMVTQVAQELGNTDKIIDEYKGDKAALIQILLRIQRENRWLPKTVLMHISERLGIPLSQIYQIATFYKAFSLLPQGRHSISVCTGTACHVRGSPRLLDRVIESLDIRPGETSPDWKFTLDTVNCLGCCALGPVVVVDGEYHSNPSSEEIEKIVAACD